MNIITREDVKRIQEEIAPALAGFIKKNNLILAGNNCIWQPNGEMKFSLQLNKKASSRAVKKVPQSEVDWGNAPMGIDVNIKWSTGEWREARIVGRMARGAKYLVQLTDTEEEDSTRWKIDYKRCIINL